MRDQYGRDLTDLRISLTDRCNLRCVYCMPAEGIDFRPSEELLQDDELLLLVRVAAELGVRKVRLTGGEPTVRPGLVPLVREIHDTAGIEDIALTTNGLLLDRLAGPLAEAGLRRVNVSLDTLDAAKFAAITRGGRVEQVTAGIAAAEAVGLVPIKINAVIVRGFNDADVVPLAALTLTRPWEVRFIEMMPFSTVGDFAEAGVVKSEETMAKIESALGALTAVDLSGDDPARTYRLPRAAGSLGFISPVSNPFCAKCGEEEFKLLPGPGKRVELDGGLSFTYEFSEKPKLGMVVLKIQVFDKKKNKISPFIITGRSDMPSPSRCTRRLGR